MNRNNFFIHLALALVLILVAAFAGQLSRWRKEWKSRVHIVPTAEKKQPATSDEIALSETRSFGSPEVLVKLCTINDTQWRKSCTKDGRGTPLFARARVGVWTVVLAGCHA